MIGNEKKGGKTELRDCAVEFCKPIRAVRGATNDDHGAKITGLGFAS